MYIKRAARLISNMATEPIGEPFSKDFIRSLAKSQPPVIRRYKSDVVEKAMAKNQKLGMNYYSEKPSAYRYDGFVSYGRQDNFNQLTDLKSGSTIFVK